MVSGDPAAFPLCRAHAWPFGPAAREVWQGQTAEKKEKEKKKRHLALPSHYFPVFSPSRANPTHPPPLSYAATTPLANVLHRRGTTAADKTCRTVIWVFLFTDVASSGLVYFYLGVLRRCSAADVEQLRDPHTVFPLFSSGTRPSGTSSSVI